MPKKQTRNRKPKHLQTKHKCPKQKIQKHRPKKRSNPIMNTPKQTPQTNNQDQCQNPYLDKDKPCSNTDIKALLQINGENLPLCHKCYDYIIDHDIGVTVEEIPEVSN